MNLFSECRFPECRFPDAFLFIFTRAITCGNALGRVMCPCVCLSVCLFLSYSFSNYCKPWRRKFLFGTQVHTSSEYLGQLCISRSSGQGQGYRRKNGIFGRNQIHTFADGPPVDWKAILLVINSQPSNDISWTFVGWYE